jgi:ABC-type transport system involved in cytochrome bd biosynthesis fused ATPase/permease subunit
VQVSLYQRAYRALREQERTPRRLIGFRPMRQYENGLRNRFRSSYDDLSGFEFQAVTQEPRRTHRLCRSELGYDSYLCDSGLIYSLSKDAKLSGGQRQRIAIARALVDIADLVIQIDKGQVTDITP